MSKEYTTAFVTSKDGTKIGYRQLGAGPGIILVHGGMMASQNFMKLGQALSDKFTVYIPDRRGRGLSGPPGPDYGIAKESEDLQALIVKTGAENIFGLSSGAICALQTSLIEPALKKVALYEPPFPMTGFTLTAWIEKYETALAKGDFGKAMVCIIKATSESSILTILPAFITAPLLNAAIKADAKKNKGDDVPLKTLIEVWHYDTIVISGSPRTLADCKNSTADLLLLEGEKSQLFLKLALNALNVALPRAKRVELKGLGHTGPDNGDKPEVVARELRSFFSAAD